MPDLLSREEFYQRYTERFGDIGPVDFETAWAEYQGGGGSGGAGDWGADMGVVAGGGGMLSDQLRRRGVVGGGAGSIAEPLMRENLATHPRSYIPDRLRLHHERTRGGHVVSFGRSPNGAIILSFQQKKTAAAAVRALNQFIGILGAANPFSIQAVTLVLAEILKQCSGEAGVANEVDPPMQGF